MSSVLELGERGDLERGNSSPDTVVDVSDRPRLSDVSSETLAVDTSGHGLIFSAISATEEGWSRSFFSILTLLFLPRSSMARNYVKRSMRSAREGRMWVGD